MYNRAYAELQLGRRQQCLELLESGKELASGASESRQRIISSALDNMRVSERGSKRERERGERGSKREGGGGGEGARERERGGRGSKRERERERGGREALVG